MKRLSIGMRLTLWYLAIFALGQLVFGAGMWLILRHNIYDMVICNVERSLLSLIMHRTGGNQTHAADMLGLNRNTLRSKLSKYGIR